jgi:hypothetical protein
MYDCCERILAPHPEEVLFMKVPGDDSIIEFVGTENDVHELWPNAPVGPVGPVGPVAPVGPVGPVDPVGPVTPCPSGPNTTLLTKGVRPAYAKNVDPRYNKLPPAYPVYVYIRTLSW